ncbi:MAG: GNAT family N-acetyltransferase [Rhizomicrobium sp.]
MTAAAFTHRLARTDDVAVLKPLMESAIRQLQKDFLPPDAIAASFEVMGLDSQLIADGTYYVVESGAAVAGCGGWSRRATLFGGDHSAGRDAALLDPATDAARVRAMYTSPAFARRGVGRTILALCEAAAAAEGFAKVELGATLAGEPLYRACGYRPIERIAVPTSSGIAIPILRMGKALAAR